MTAFGFLVSAGDMVRSCVVQTHLEVAYAHRFRWFSPRMGLFLLLWMAFLRDGQDGEALPK